MPKTENNDILERIADALERLADSVVSLEALFVEREKKFEAKKFDKPRGGFGGDRGGPRGGGVKKDFGDKPFKKRFNDDDAGGDDFDEFKKRGPKSTFRDFDAPKNFKGKPGPRGAAGKPAGKAGFKPKKKF